MAQGTSPLSNVFQNNILVRIRAGQNIPRATFTRADATTCATYIKNDGLLYTAAANVLRTEWVDLDGDGIRETPGILLEGSRTNSILRSEQFDNAAWVSNGTPIVTANIAPAAPDGASSADKMEDDSAAVLEGKTQAITVPNDGATSVIGLFVAKRTGAPSLLLQGFLSGGTSVDARVMMNPATGAKIASGVTNHGVISINANWWFVWLGVQNNTTGNTSLTVGVFPAARAAGDVSTTTETVATLGYNNVWGAMASYNVQFPGSYIGTVASAITRAADSLTFPFNFGPMDMTALARVARPIHADLSGALSADFIITEVSATTNPRLLLYLTAPTRTLGAQVVDGNVNPQATATIPVGAELRIAAKFQFPTAGAKVAIDVGSGYTAFSQGADPVTTFGNQTLRVGTAPGFQLYGVLLDLIIARGLYSLQRMLQLAGRDT